MAPISSRRSGHSRRAQYSLFTGYALAAIGALLGAALLAVSLLNPSAFSGLRMSATDAVVPVAAGGARTRAATGGVLAGIAAYWRAGSQNAALRREVELARIRLGEAKALEQENRERSEEHTSELQSLMRISYAVFCLKKKKQKNQ